MSLKTGRIMKGIFLIKSREKTNIKSQMISKGMFKKLIIILYFFITFFFKLKYLRHGTTDFYEMFIDNKEYQDLLHIFLLKKSFPVGRYIRLSFFLGWFCPPLFSKTIKDRKLKFSGIIDFWILRWDQVKTWMSLPAFFPHQNMF